jgi:hypothetical protein
MKYSDKNMFLCWFVNHKSHVEDLGIEKEALG